MFFGFFCTTSAASFCKLAYWQSHQSRRFKGDFSDIIKSSMCDNLRAAIWVYGVWHNTKTTFIHLLAQRRLTLL
jgi:hypothetical protein